VKEANPGLESTKERALKKRDRIGLAAAAGTIKLDSSSIEIQRRRGSNMVLSTMVFSLQAESPPANQ